MLVNGQLEELRQMANEGQKNRSSSVIEEGRKGETGGQRVQKQAPAAANRRGFESVLVSNFALI